MNRLQNEYLNLAAGASINVLGKILLNEYMVPFEFASILLLTAMIGTVLLSKKEKLENYVEFLGYLNSNELITKLQSIDIFLFSSTKEGFPFSILEAINYKIPVICNKFNAISNIFKNKKHIIYTKNGNTEEFANLVNMLNNNKNLYENIKRNAHKILIKRFNINSVNKSFLKLL
jgi:glycosyltransferase involved in cell wall biosynthesis